MTTWSMAGKQSLLSLLIAYLSKVSRKSTIRFVAGVKTLLRLCLVVGALVAFTVAAWMVAVPLGVLVLGICLLVFEWVIKR